MSEPVAVLVARELVAHPRFAWSEGMRNVLGCRRVDEPSGDWLDDMGEWLYGDPRDGTGLVSPPDLADAATAGVLVSMLDPSGMRGTTFCRERDGTWWVDTYTAPTLGEAVARALLASWGPA